MINPRLGPGWLWCGLVPGASGLVRDIGAVAISLFLAYIALRFFDYSVAALARDVPYVTAGIMSAFIGLMSLTGAVAVARDWLLARKAAEAEGEAGARG